MTAESTATVEKKENRASQVSKELAEAKAKIAQLEALISAKDASKADASILDEVAHVLSPVADKGKKMKTNKEKKRQNVDSEDDIPLRQSCKAAKMQAAAVEAAAETDKKVEKSRKKAKSK
jgi:hypothetical protein